MFEITRDHLKIIGTERMTHSKFHENLLKV